MKNVITSVRELSPGRLFEGFKSLRISEVLLWVVTFAQVSLLILAWVFMWLAGFFPVVLTYPVIGRLLILLVFAALLVLTVHNRQMIITLASLAYLVGLLGLDSALVEIVGQSDRFLGELYLSGFQPVIAILGFLLPLLLIWTALLAVARVVRRRTRDRLDEWVEVRRTSIFGSEDHAGNEPARISVLAVLALIFAIAFPVMGLVLSYAARNDFVAAKPRKSGLDLAVAATIVGWFGLGLQLLLAVTWILATVLLGVGLLEFIGQFVGLIFGLN
jgi:hypothetical protein